MNPLKEIHCLLQLQRLHYTALQTLLNRLPHQTNKKRRVWVTADEHYFHKNILRYQKRPFQSVEEMNETLKKNHNTLVQPDDWTIHIGDFLFGNAEDFKTLVQTLNGFHAFLDGSHDHALHKYFLKKDPLTPPNISSPLPEPLPKSLPKAILLPKLFEFTYNKTKIVLCHYAMRTWWASHYGSLHFHGHSHGKLPSGPTYRDVGVDTTNYKPLLLEDAIASLPNSNPP